MNVYQVHVFIPNVLLYSYTFLNIYPSVNSEHNQLVKTSQPI